MTAPLLITGATGFIGQHLYRIMSEDGQPLRCALRRPVSNFSDTVQVGDIDGTTDWQEALHNVELVIHLAGRAHILKENSGDPLSEFRRVNVQGALRLAQQMIDQGCRRLVYVSSIGVNGDLTPINQPFTEMSPPAPQMPYALAKWEAEQQLELLKSQLEIVIVRPPLVYGPGAPGNFGRLLRLVRRGLPLPLGAAHNRRSLVAVQNLCDFLRHCAQHPAAAGELFLISDGEDLSTPDLLRRMATALDCPLRLLPVPESLLRLPLRAAGRERMLNQLFGSLLVDSSKARQQLEWQPLLTMDQALSALNETPDKPA